MVASCHKSCFFRFIIIDYYTCFLLRILFWNSKPAHNLNSCHVLNWCIESQMQLSSYVQPDDAQTECVANRNPSHLLPATGHRGVQLCDAVGRHHWPPFSGRAIGRFNRRGGALGGRTFSCTAIDTWRKRQEEIHDGRDKKRCMMEETRRPRREIWIQMSNWKMAEKREGPVSIEKRQSAGRMDGLTNWLMELQAWVRGVHVKGRGNNGGI